MNLEQLEYEIAITKSAYHFKKLLEQLCKQIPNDDQLGEYLRKSIKDWVNNEKYIISMQDDDAIHFIDKNKLQNKKYEQQSQRS